MVENEPDITGPSECMYADVVGTVVCTLRSLSKVSIIRPGRSRLL